MISKRSHLLLIGLLLLLTACAQKASQNGAKNNSIGPPYKSLKIQADELNQASIKGDDARVADLTYPKLIELMGGREQYLKILKAIRDDMESEHFTVVSATVDDPNDIIEAEGQIYATLPLTIRMKVAEGVLVGRSAMIGISNDRGKNWTFVNANSDQMKTEMLKNLFPTVADKLKLPEASKPVLEQSTPTP